MKTLKDISSESIRQNWLSYKDEIYNSHYYELLWDTLENKFKIAKDDMYLIIFKKFIDNEEITPTLFDRIHINQVNNETLVFKGLNGKERKYIHLLCDKIGLHHESKSHREKKYIRFLYIYKPKIWLWEFSEKNPYSKSEEYYAKRELEKEEQLNENLRKKYCCICKKNGWKTELFCSIYIGGLYCENCLETTSDGGGGKLCDHKFELL